MKTFILTAILATGLTAFAGQENYGIGQDQYQPEAIYKALKVKEKHLNPGIAGIGRFEKSVGGLTCTREQLVAPNAKPTFECSIDQSKENFARIYKALDAKEKFLNPGIAGVSRFEKSVGGLTCIREQLVAPNAKPTFECQMTE